MTRLVIYRGDERLAEHDLARAVIGLGRHPENDIVLDDRTLSRFHARIEKRAGNAFVVVDLGAQNGVHKNGERIEKESELQSGDRIELGRYTAVFEAPSSKPKVNGKNGHAKIEIEDDSIDIDVGGGGEDDAIFDPEVEDATANGRKDVDKTGAVSDFDNGASSVEFVPPKPTFVLLFNGMEVSRHPLGDAGLTVGRSKHCEIVISLLGLSRRHARLVPGDDGVAVEDLGSQNGTWVNNQRIEGSRVLRHGDLLNFYDYGVLFLEDGEVDVGFSSANKRPSPSTEQGRADLSANDTDLGMPVASAPRVRQPTQRSPMVDAKDVKPGVSLRPAPIVEETDRRGRPTPKKRKADKGEEDSRFDMDLGEGSFLGDEFEDGASKDRKPPDRKRNSPDTGTDLLEGVDVSRGGGDEDLEAEIAFAAAASDDDEFADSVGGTDGEIGRLADRTTAGFDTAGLGAGSWPTDDELERVLAASNDIAVLTLDVSLKGKPYAQIPVSNLVTRIGGDPRCEVPLPKSAGLRPWHCTLMQLGGAVVIVRGNRAAFIDVAGKQADAMVMKNNDTLKMGNVEIRIRLRSS